MSNLGGPGDVPAVRLRDRRAPEELLRRDQRGCPGHVGPRHRPARSDSTGSRPSRRAVSGTTIDETGVDRPGASERRRSAVVTVVLAIETSCDETAAAVVEDGRRGPQLGGVQPGGPARPFGGVVPEVAGRAHVELLTPVVAEALRRGGRRPVATVDAVAATIGPGLVGSLLVGVSAAKAYALAWGVPFVGVNHMEGHLHAAFLEDPDLALPGGRAARVGWSHHARRTCSAGRPLPAARADHRRRRGGGLRQGGPVPRARLPGRAGHRPPGRPAAIPGDARSRGACAARATTSPSPA